MHFRNDFFFQLLPLCGFFFAELSFLLGRGAEQCMESWHGGGRAGEGESESRPLVLLSEEREREGGREGRRVLLCVPKVERERERESWQDWLERESVSRREKGRGGPENSGLRSVSLSLSLPICFPLSLCSYAREGGREGGGGEGRCKVAPGGGGGGRGRNRGRESKRRERASFFNESAAAPASLGFASSSSSSWGRRRRRRRRRRRFSCLHTLEERMRLNRWRQMCLRIKKSTSLFSLLCTRTHHRRATNWTQ